ncbi:hypothetical protein B0O99DRAFT_529390 [Bisporella sp. PMI_857]|nr:hypothetical protein B0O99DRAFT_529390 [Bisporella sp. PMI_857]
MANILKRRSQRLHRRTETLINKSYKIAKFCDVDIALFLRIRKTGQLIVYKSTDTETWPPSKEEARQCIYPLPANLLSQDIEAGHKKHSNATSNITLSE